MVSRRPATLHKHLNFVSCHSPTVICCCYLYIHTYIYTPKSNILTDMSAESLRFDENIELARKVLDDLQGYIDACAMGKRAAEMEAAHVTKERDECVADAKHTAKELTRAEETIEHLTCRLAALADTEARLHAIMEVNMGLSRDLRAAQESLDAKATSIEHMNAMHQEELGAVKESLACKLDELKEVDMLKLRLQELEAENAEFKRVSRIVSLQNENNRLREELRVAQDAARKKKSFESPLSSSASQQEVA
jgi:hypothetical protein